MSVNRVLLHVRITIIMVSYGHTYIQTDLSGILSEYYYIFILVLDPQLTNLINDINNAFNYLLRKNTLKAKENMIKSKMKTTKKYF